MRQWVWPVALALLLLAAEPLAGWLPVAAAVVVLALAVVLARFAAWPRVALALAGGLAGALSAVEALARNDPGEPRWWFGAAALACAAIASAAAVVPRRFATLAAAIVGGVAINLLDINTFYLVAVPAWLAATIAPSHELRRRRGD